MQTEYLLIAGLLLAVLILQLVALLRRPPHDRLEQAGVRKRAPGAVNCANSSMASPVR